MKLLTTPDDLGPCQVYCEQLKDEVRRLRANVDLMKPGDVFVCQKHFAEVEQTTEEDKSCQYCERDTAQAEATRLRAYVLKASVAATEREAALTDVSRLEAAQANYSDIAELLFGEAEYEHDDVRLRVVAILDELEALKARTCATCRRRWPREGGLDLCGKASIYGHSVAQVACQQMGNTCGAWAAKEQT